jgi:hypothetical protein
MGTLAERGLTVLSSLVAVAALSLLGCNSTPNRETTEAEQAAPSAQNSAAQAVQSSTGPDIDLNCVIDHIQDPPESFHYTFKDVSDNPWEEEADVTPQKIDGSFKSNSLPKPQEFHGAPREVASNLHAIARLASTIALVQGSPAVVREGTENVNGYDTVKYSIDTARGGAAEQELYLSTLGKGGFERGTVWVTDKGCPVRLTLDEEMRAKDGGLLGKSHSEEAMVKK